MNYMKRFGKEKTQKTVRNQRPDRMLARRVLAAVTAVSVVGQPFAALASTVTRVNGTQVNFNNKVGHIFADKLINGDKVAVNQFEKFNITAGDIANMYFKTAGGNKWAGSLVNLVNDHIDVAGTVNAIRDNQIGGNLFFLSSSGMAVTGSGVINAGSLTVLTPTEDVMHALQNELIQDSRFDTMIDNPESVAINPSGTITIEGTVNTIGDIRLYGGEKVSVSGVLRTRPGSEWKTERPIISDAAFPSVVNVGTGEESGTVTGNISWAPLTAVEAGDGSIILSAVSAADGREAKSVAEVNVTGKLIGNNVSAKAVSEVKFSGSGAPLLDTGEWEFSPVEISIDGEHLEELGLSLSADSAKVTNKASVNIGEDALIQAMGETELLAKSTASVDVGVEMNSGDGISVIPASAVTYADVTNMAAVNIEGDIKAGSNISASADASTEISANASAAIDETTGAAAANSGYIAVSIVDNNTSAKVNINKGKDAGRTEQADEYTDIDAGGGLDIQANVTNSLESTAEAAGTNQTALATAVNIVNSNGSAEVNINGASLSGDSASIHAQNTLDGNAISADNGVGEPPKKFVIGKGQKLEDMVAQAEGILGTMADGGESSSEGSSIDSYLSDALNTAISAQLSNVGGKDPLKSVTKTLGKYLDVGASVAVANETNTAAVHLKDASITATGAGKTENPGQINIGADTIIRNSSMNVSGSVTAGKSKKKKGDKTILAADAAVLVSNMDNSATVSTEGVTAISGKNVAIDSATTMGYNVKTMIEDMKDAVQELIDQCEEVGKEFSDWSELKADLEGQLTKLNNMYIGSEEMSNEDTVNELFSGILGDLADVGLTITNSADKIQGALGDRLDALTDVKDALVAVNDQAFTFAHPENYLNYYVRTTDASSLSSKPGTSGVKLGLAGSVNVSSVRNNASTILGAGTLIDASNQADIKSSVETNTISITGNANEMLKKKKSGSGSGSKGTSIGAGASVAVQDISNASLVMVGAGSEIKAANTLNIGADNVMNQTGVVYNAGQAGTVALEGMVNLLNGGSNTVVSIDDDTVLEGKKVNLFANNNSTLTAVSGGATLGNDSTAASVGASVTLALYDVNNVLIVGDNETVQSEDAEESSGTASEKAQQKQETGTALAQAMAKDALGRDDLSGVMGSSDTSGQGSITAGELKASAATSGMINSIAIEAAANSKSLKTNALTRAEEPAAPQSALANLAAVLGEDNAINTQVESGINAGLDQVDQDTSGQAMEDILQTGDELVNGSSTGDSAAQNVSVANALPSPLAGGGPTQSSTASSVNVAGAGSVAVNMLGGETAAILDGITVNSTEKGSVDVSAEDSLFSGAWAGGAAVNWFSGGSTSGGAGSKTEVSIGGAAGVSIADRGVSSIISNSSINHAGSINNTAVKSGAEVAAGLGLSVAKSTGTNVGISAAVSYNKADNDLYALLVDNQVNTTPEAADEENPAQTAIVNHAVNQDLQITGGLSMSAAVGGKTNVGGTGSVAISDLDTDMQSGIYQGRYEDVGNVDVEAVVGTKQISAAVGAAVAAGGSGTSVGFSGAVGYNTVTNNNRAFIEGAAVISSGNVDVKAYDTDEVDRGALETYLNDRGVDTSGQTGTTADTELAEGGSLIVNVAASLAASGGNNGGSLGAAVNISDVDNDLHAEISGADITAASVNGLADTNTQIVSVAAGFSGSGGKFAGAGSVSWDTLSNNNIVTIEDSTIHADQLIGTAQNQAHIVNVAGQLSATGTAGSVGAGLALAYNNMDNMTGVYINGGKTDDGEVKSISGRGDGTVSIETNAQNEAHIMAIGAGVTASAGVAAVNGAIAINRGANSTEAVIGNTEEAVHIANASKISVSASDATQNTTGAGGVTASSTGGAVGGSVAYSDIGGASSDSEKAAQNVRAEINRASITTAADSTIGVSASDTAKMDTYALGLSASGSVAVQGAAAASLINKNVTAGMTGTSIHAAGHETAEDGHGNAAVTVEASNQSEIDSYAVVAGVASTGAGGAGVGVNRIVQNTEAFIKEGSQDVANAKVLATGQPKITATGVGAGVGGTVGIGGSVGVNMVANNVKAGLSGTNLYSTGNVGVVAQSDEQIENYAGAVGVGGTAAVGVNVAVNTISGDTEAYVENSDVTAKGSESDKIETHSGMADDAVLSDVFSESTADSDRLQTKRQSASETGLVVDSSATHSVSSVLATAGASGTAAVSGTVNVNTIGGSTAARVENASFNTGLAQEESSLADVNVRASDYTNSSGMTIAAAASGVASVGASSDTALVTRGTSAKVTGREGTESRAHDFKVQAAAEQGISHFTTSAAAAANVGVGGTVLVDKLQSHTSAAANGLSVDYTGSAAVKAAHEDGVYAGQVTAAGGMAGVGLTVNVVNQESEVEASVKDSQIASDSADSSAEVKAENTNHLSSVLASVGAGIGGVSGTTTVNNLAQTVTAAIENSTITGGKIDVLAHSLTDTKANMGNIGAGAVGVGASVSVNTFDDAVNTSVTGSTLAAANGGVSVKAEEERNIDQLVINGAAGAVGVGANIMVTNINSAIEDSDTLAKIDEANKAGTDYSENMIGLSEDEIQAIQEASAIEAGKGGGREDAGVHVAITGSEVSSDSGKVDIQAVEANDVAMTGGAAAAGAASVSASVGILNVKHQTGVTLDQSNVSGNSVSIEAIQKNKDKGINLNVYQGTAGYFGTLGGTYAGLSTSGTSAVTVNGGSIKANAIDISAKDTSSATLNSTAVAVSAGITAGVLVAEAENDSDSTVSITNGVQMESGSDDGSIRITSEKNNAVTAAVNQVSGGLVTGSGMGVTVTDTGSSTVNIGDNNQLKAKALAIAARSAPVLKANVVGVDGGLLGSGAVNVARVSVGSENDALMTGVNLGTGNVLSADTMEISAESNVSQGLDMDAVSISGYASLGGNTTTAETYSTVYVSAGNNTYKGQEDSSDADVSFRAQNMVTQTADTRGVQVAGAFATGTNIAGTTSQLTTKVNIDGSAEGSRIGDLDASASSYAKVSNTVKGDGGAIADISPYAAKANNNFTADTDVTIKGMWNAAGDVTAQALNGMDIDLKSDAVRAAVVGGSGTRLANTINNAANVTLDGAQITSGGMQGYTAQNQVDYTGEIDGSGYGGINVNATDYSDDLDFTAGVDIKGSTLESTGDDGGITAFASTEGTIHSKNSLKSAGVIPIALAFSDHAVDYHNSVNVTDSTLTTDKAGSDITLAATDDTDVKLETIADTQGGAIGAASAEAANALDRSNKINVGAGSTLHSTNDVNLYAGADESEITSSLDLQVLADAYNKTAIPLATDPEVDNTMTQSNQVELGGTAESVRHINVSAGRGTTTVTTSAQEYKVWTGTGGEGEVASTAFGDTISDETADNAFKLTGTGSATAGIHNKLNIEISGQTTTQAPTVSKEERPIYVQAKDGNGNLLFNEDGSPQMVQSGTETVDIITGDGSISYDGIQVNVTDGADWFKPEDNVTMKDRPLENGFMERYNEVLGYLAAYDKDSDAYKAYDAERQLLLQEMLKAGLAEETKGADGSTIITPLTNPSTPAVELSDIVVSGGNINISADNLIGDAGTKLTAQGAPQLTITNKSDLYLAVNDLTISDNGGNINMAGVNAERFGGTLTNPGTTGETPAITIHGATDDAAAFGTDKHVQADIGIFGDITNSAGKIDITSDNYNILIEGNVNGRDIAIKAARGDVTQTNPEGLINIGQDPIANIQFSEDVAKKIQTYLYGQKKDGSLSFADYGAYLYWLLHTVKVTPAELGLDEEISSLSAEELNQKFAPQNGDNNKENVILAGGNVYISGLNVNIAGLVQSGYGDYGTTLSADAQKKVEAIDSKWQANRTPLSDADVLGNSEYLVNEGGEVWNETTKVWDYEVKVYYNPSTGQLLTESVRPDGGQIQINGKISSTGNGRIVAADGTADIHIDTTAVNKDVKVNSITGSDISGLITITDKNKTNADGDYQVTEYRNGAYRTYWTGDDTTGIGWTTTDDALTYKPEEGTQFAWTGGVTGERQEEYSYTEDFLFWGALAYNKSEDLLNHIAQVGAKPTPGPVTSGENPESMANGSLVTDGYSGGDNMLTISWDYSKKDNMTATDPDVEKKYDGTAGKIFGYGEYIYTWIQKQGDQIASSSGLKADEAIQIGFLGNGNGSGNIEVNTAGDMLLNGSVSNAAIIDESSQIVGKGSVSLTSGGSISGNAFINSDDVNLKANGDITVNHAAIGSGAALDAVSDTGSIAFTSTKGDLTIEQALAGGNSAITAETGNVSIEAAGDILDGHTSGNYTVKGQRIDLVSTGGSIGTKDKALTLLAGSDLYSSDTMASSINAQAAGDIVLTQAAGNMRLGTIVSENGDAVLTVTNGSFVDAHPSENSSSSTAEDKIDRWLEAGLISEDDDANSSTEAAEEAEALRVGALEKRMNSLAAAGAHTVDEYKAAAKAFLASEDMKTAKADYIKAVSETKDQAAIKAAYDKYQAAQTQYFKDAGYDFSADEMTAVTSYAEVAGSDNYGWSKNQLLYAIQDSVLNATPGEVPTTVETPNVSAQNITLNAAHGGIGIDGEAQTISYDALNSEENLKLLANAKAGDLTWDSESQTVTIRQQQAITVDVADGGDVNVTGRDNVYLAGVKDTLLDVNDIETAGDIRLQGDAGIVVDSLKGQDLTIAGGSGGIGSHDEGYVQTDLSGSIDANATGDISFSDVGDMDILTIASAGAVNLKAAGSILMKDVEDSQAQGYINAGTVLNLDAGSSIGDSGKALRVLDNGVVVNAAAGSAIYLSGVSGQESADSLVLGTIEGASLDVDSVSAISLGRADDESTEESEAVSGSITTTEGDASITAASVDLADGTVNVGTHDFNVTANAGDITQSAASAGLTANHVNLTSTGSQQLLSENNQINSVTVRGLVDDSLTGGVEIHNAAENFAVQFGDAAGGVTVHNGGIDIRHTGSGTLTVSGSAVTNEEDEAADANIAFTSKTGGIAVTGNMTAGDAFSAVTTSGPVKIEGSVTAQDDVTATTGSGAVEFTGTVLSEAGDVSTTTGSGSIAFGSSVTATSGNIIVDTDEGTITVNGAANAGTDIMLESGAGAITVTGNATAQNDFLADTGSGDITLQGTVTAVDGNASASTITGDILVVGTVTSGGDTMLTTSTTDEGKGHVTVEGSITADDNVTVTTSHGDVTLGTEGSGDEVSALDGAVMVTTDSGDITVNGSTEAAQDISLTSTHDGDITVNGTTTTGTDIKLESGAGAITVTGNATAQNEFLADTGSGDITLQGTVTAEKGNASASTITGDILVDGAVKSGGDTTLTTSTTDEGKGHVTVEGSIEAGDNVTVTTNHGDVTLGAEGSDDKVSALGGAVMVTTNSGDITVNGSTDAAKNISLTSTHDGDITVNGTADAGTDIGLTSGSGAITTTGSLTAAQNVLAKTENGAIILGGDVTATAGNVTANTQAGDIAVNGTTHAGIDIGLTSGSGAITTIGSLTAAQHVLAETGSGNIQLGGSVTAAAGNIAADSGSGDITFSDTATAGQHISAETENGSIAFGGTTTANAGNVTASVTGEGNVTFGGAVNAHGTAETAGSIHATVAAGNITAEEGAALTADRDVHLQTQNGDITFNEVVNAGEDLFAQVVHSGSILVRDDLTAEQDITLNTNIGDILFEGKTDDVHEKIQVTSNQGDVLLKVEEGGHGDIRDTNREANGDHAVIHAALGNVTTENGGIEADGDDSDIDLYEVYAKEDSKISTAEGDLHLVNVSGNLVAVVVRKPGKQMESEHVEAATEIQIAGSNMDLDDIVQREDGDGFLTITPDGVDDNTPIDNLVISDIKTNGGVRFNRLWLNIGDIHVSSGAFHLDKLYVEDKATFSTPHMATDVFGSAPVYDDTRDSAYWINTDINRPNSDLNAWKADGTHGQWMYLHFDADSPVQHSNGNLLHLQDHNDTYSQRYSMTDWMNIFSDKDFYRFYDRYYAPELSYHDRYGLIDGAGVSADNAESDEITVE